MDERIANELPQLHRLRRRLARLFNLRDVTVTIPGTPIPYVMTLPADPDAPLDQLMARQKHQEQEQAGRSQQTDAPIGQAETLPVGNTLAIRAARQAQAALTTGAYAPYWSLLWPSGMALAEALMATPEIASGRRTLELGCGLGVTATAALACGARLWAADLFAEALLFCRYNTLRNAGRSPQPVLVNWRTELGRAACMAAGPFDLLLGADVLYEEEDIQPLLTLAEKLLPHGGDFWLAEPGRRTAQTFALAAALRGWRDETTVYTSHWADEDRPSRVVVHRFTLSEHPLI